METTVTFDVVDRDCSVHEIGVSVRPGLITIDPPRRPTIARCLAKPRRGGARNPAALTGRPRSSTCCMPGRK